MTALAECLRDFFGGYFIDRVQHDPAANVRIGVIGLPDAILADLFELLTGAGTHELEAMVGSVTLAIPVLLLGAPSAGTTSGVLSRRCGWDYAVTVRNSCPFLLLLIPISSADSMPESLANAIEIFGQLNGSRRRNFFSDLLWSYTIDRICAKTGADKNEVGQALAAAAANSSDLPPDRRNEELWRVANGLLATESLTLSASDKLAFATGFPIIGTTGKNIRNAAAALNGLAKVFGTEGLASGVELLKDTQTAVSLLLDNELNAFVDHIRSKGALSGATFERTPSLYFKPDDPAVSWWNALDVDTLQKLLDDIGDGTAARLNLVCRNAIPDIEGRSSRPDIVVSAVQLRAHAPDAGLAGDVTFSCRIGRGAPSILANKSGSPSEYEDVDPPQHDRPLRYEAAAAGFEAAHVDVISLEQFACGGILRPRYAEKSTIPSKHKRSGQWTQAIVLNRSGPTEVAVLHSAKAVRVAIKRIDGPPSSVVRDVTAGSHETRITLEVENGDMFEVTVEFAAGKAEAKWTASFAIDEESRFIQSQFESLISAHQSRGRRIPPRAPDTLVQKLEAQYLQSEKSWKSVLACWSTPVIAIGTIDWDGGAVLGDAKPPVDPRVIFTPPAAVLLAREALRTLLVNKACPIAEIDLGTDEFRMALVPYLTAYRDWLASDPRAACWWDCVAVHAAAFNKQIGTPVASSEPLAILLSPLHPLRIGWHVHAQSELAGGITAPCPAAGLFDPTACPDSGGWQMSLGAHQSAARAFFALQSENPHWSILWNRNYLGLHPQRLDVVARLSELGLRSHGLPGGFSRSQSLTSVQEVSKLVPARSVLRLGLIGEKDGSLPCAEGIMDWCKEQFNEETDRLRPDQVEIYDIRESQEPSAERIATLSNQTGEHVKWFRPQTLSAAPPQDLVILDQLGVETPTGVTGTSRAAVSAGALSRIRIREDFTNALWIRESRIGVLPTESGNVLADGLLACCVEFEKTSLVDSNIGHLQFQPNQQALGTQLKNAIYLAVTSRQIDPACIIRGARGQNVYLWNYELPATLGGEEEGQGYYLIADPRPAMKEAIRDAARLIVDPPPEPEVLLDEISRRGIPILKRLAAGGTQSRGEIGLLLAVRLLQDSFRGTAHINGLPVAEGPCIHLIAPVDPYEQPFERLRSALTPQLSGQRPDLLLFGIHLPDENTEGRLKIRVTPIEVKYRQGKMPNVEIQDALQQAANFGQLLEALWSKAPVSNVWAISARTLMGRCLDLAFRIYADENVHQLDAGEWTRHHERVLRAVLRGDVDLAIGSGGTLLVFDGSDKSEVFDLNGGRVCVVDPTDQLILLNGSGELSSSAASAYQDLALSAPGCRREKEGSGPKAGPSKSAEVIPTVTELIVAEPTQPTEGVPPHVHSPVAGEKHTDSDDEVQDQVVLRPASTAVPVEIRQRVRDVFAGFIGNEAAVLRVQNDLLRALIERPPYLSKNYLFTGQPSTGKTEIARRITKALALPFVKLDGGGLRTRERLLILIKAELNDQKLTVRDVGRQSGLPLREYPPMCVFVDEIHLVPRTVQESFLTVLESNDRTVTLEEEVAVMRRTTFLFATTRASELDRAFVSRCTEIRLREYTVEEVAEIVRRQFTSQHWPEQVYRDISRFGRQVPRVALDLARELETAITVSDTPSAGVEAHLDAVRLTHELDEHGLTPDDVAYLDLLSSEGRMGEQAIAKMLGTVDPDRVTGEIEPFLRKLGFIRFGPRGREITISGREYVVARRRK